MRNLPRSSVSRRKKALALEAYTQVARQFLPKLGRKKNVAKYPSVFFEDPFAGFEDGQK